MRLSAHLSFDGSCEQAFRFYQQVLNGQLVTLLTYGQSPLAQDTPAEFHDRILHATLTVGSFELLGADVLPDQAERPQGFCITLSLTDVQRANEIFSALADGGIVRMPLQDTFWSPAFGLVTDRFGIPWEINCEPG